MQAGNDTAKKWEFKVAGKGAIMEHLAPAAEKSKSVVFKGQPEVRKWLRGGKGELFQLNGHKRKINPQLRSAPRGEKEAEGSKAGTRCSRGAHWRGGTRQIHKEHRNLGRWVFFN